MRTTALMMAALLVAASQVFAQSPAAGFSSSISSVVGGGRTWDDEGQIGGGLLIGVSVERRLFGGTSAEISLDTLRHERTGRFSAAGRTLLVGGAVVQRVGRSSAQPYVLAGVTLAHHRGTFGFPQDNLTSRTDSTHVGLVLGGGLSVPIGKRYEVGPEARFVMLASDVDAAPAFADWLGVRFGIRF